jgi:hypothetical protein
MVHGLIVRAAATPFSNQAEESVSSLPSQQNILILVRAAAELQLARSPSGFSLRHWAKSACQVLNPSNVLLVLVAVPRAVGIKEFGPLPSANLCGYRWLPSLETSKHTHPYVSQFSV